MIFHLSNTWTSDFVPNAFELTFTQSFKSSLGKIKKSKGKIDYLFPSHFRFKEFKGNTEFVSNPKKSWYYSPPFAKGEKGEVQVNTSHKLMISELFDKLKKGLKNNDSYSVKKSKNYYQIRFNKKVASELKIKSLNLFYDTKRKLISIEQLKSMDIFYVDDKKVSIAFEKLNPSVKFSNKHFVFNIPPNTNIVKN
jgi:outer membrane lipoprotein-sorting protein